MFEMIDEQRFDSDKLLAKQTAPHTIDQVCVHNEGWKSRNRLTNMDGHSSFVSSVGSQQQ